MSFLLYLFHQSEVVGVTSRSPLERQTPVRELAEFEKWCRDRPVSIHESATQAVLEHLPAEFVPSGYRTETHELEQQLAEDLRHADLLGDSSMKKTRLDENDRSSLRAQDKVKCRIHIDDALLEALEKYTIAEEGKARGWVGVYFAEALREYRDRGQSRRLQEWYARLRENVDFLPSDRKTRTQQIVDEVSCRHDLSQKEQPSIHERAIDDVVREKTDAEVDTAIREYRQRVLDELGFDPVSTHDGVHAPPDVAEEMEADAAMEEIEPAQYEAMDRAGRVEHLRTTLRQRAAADDGSDSFTYTDVIKKVFGPVDGPSHNYAYTLMEEAAEVDGFRYGEHNGQTRLRFNDDWLGQPDAGLTGDEDDGADTFDTTDELVTAAVGRLEDKSDVPESAVDPVVTTAIAQALHFGEDDPGGREVPGEARDRVTDEQRDLVKERLDWIDSSETANSDEPMDEPDTVDEDGLAAEWEALEEAERAMTDGGVDIEGADCS